jgi:hypothetical protein
MFGTMLKAYITKWTEEPQERHTRFDVRFDSHPQNAAYWKTKEQAENECVIFDRLNIVIPSAEGGTHICNGFRVEERKPEEFVIFYEGPFIPQSRG